MSLPICRPELGWVTSEPQQCEEVQREYNDTPPVGSKEPNQEAAADEENRHYSSEDEALRFPSEGSFPDQTGK
jgi:hypothetical protein